MFGRRSTSPESETTDLEAKLGGKGRPTPTRKEAEAARKARLAPSKGRKAAGTRNRDANRENRAKMREALETGDDRYLPPRDQGPVKRHIRDFIDSRRTVGEVLLPVFFVVFILFFLFPAASQLSSFLWIAILALMVLDSFRMSRGAKAAVRKKFGDDADLKGVSMYAIMRAWQMRRLRLPKPQVSAGDSI